MTYIVNDISPHVPVRECRWSLVSWERILPISFGCGGFDILKKYNAADVFERTAREDRFLPVQHPLGPRVGRVPASDLG
jgi:hypothetical protein